MASLFLTADIVGRQRSAMVAIAFAAAVMVTSYPQILWTASFQMSFMAMVGLIFIAPLFQAMGNKAIKLRWDEDRTSAPFAPFISDSFSISLGTIIGVGPLIAYHFGIISFTGPPANLLTLPTLPAIIVTSALTGGIGLIALPVAQVIGGIAWLFLSYLLVVVNAFATIPSSFIEVSPVSPKLIGGYYLLLGLGIWLYNRRRGSRLSATILNQGGR
jgi:competence protein ComEC